MGTCTVQEHVLLQQNSRVEQLIESVGLWRLIQVHDILALGPSLEQKSPHTLLLCTAAAVTVMSMKIPITAITL